MSTKSKLTMHELGIGQEKKGLTSHVKRHSKRAQTIPEVDAVIPIDFHGIVFDTDDQGQPKTPMAKIRFNLKANKWEQVSVAEAGMLVFYNSEPQPHHTKARIVSIIPNGRACYAEPE